MNGRPLPETLRNEYLACLARWPVPGEQLTVATRQGDTFVMACGNESAPPVVLLHGALTNAASWMFDAAAWSEAFRVYAVDVIGEPGLSAPSHPRLDSDAWACWLDDVLDGLGLAHASFVGMSFGGWIALDYARRRPGRVSRLALLCPAGIGKQKAFLWKALPLLLLGSWGASRIRSMVMGPQPVDLPENVSQLMTFLQRLRTSVRPRPMRIPRLSDDALRDLGMPVLAIAGDRDVLLDSRETMARISALVQRGTVHMVKAGYHYLPGQRGRIRAFLST